MLEAGRNLTFGFTCNVRFRITQPCWEHPNRPLNPPDIAADLFPHKKFRGQNRPPGDRAVMSKNQRLHIVIHIV